TGQCHINRGGKCKNGFSRTGCARQIDQMDAGIKQEIKRHGLINIPWMKPPGLALQHTFAVLMFYDHNIGVNCYNPTNKSCLVQKILVGINLVLDTTATQSVKSFARVRLFSFNRLNVIPETARKLDISFMQLI